MLTSAPMTTSQVTQAPQTISPPPSSQDYSQYATGAIPTQTRDINVQLMSENGQEDAVLTEHSGICYNVQKLYVIVIDRSRGLYAIYKHDSQGNMLIYCIQSEGLVNNYFIARCCHSALSNESNGMAYVCSKTVTARASKANVDSVNLCNTHWRVAPLGWFSDDEELPEPARKKKTKHDEGRFHCINLRKRIGQPLCG